MGVTRKVSEEELPPIHQSRAGSADSGLRSLTTSFGKDRTRDKENMADYIAKKREMFLVQMALDTKREGIRKVNKH